jgi:SAM-dependent methyltransferase
VNREKWDRTYSGPALAAPDLAPSGFAQWVLHEEGSVPTTLVDVGCGRGVDALWFARQGAHVVGLDYVLRGSDAVAELAAREPEPLELEFRAMNLCELRSVLAESARLARLPGRTVVTARHVADATDKVGRAHLWRACEMMLSGGGRLYLEFLVHRGEDDPFARHHHLHTLSVGLVVEELRSRGATVVSRRRIKDLAPGASKARRICRMVVEWQR